MIIEKLLKDGKVSRNWALRHYIARLSARINDLVHEGWKFDDRKTDREVMKGRFIGGDYFYYLTVVPKNYRK